MKGVWLKVTETGTKTPELIRTEREERAYAETMGRALEANANEVRWMRGLGLVQFLDDQELILAPLTLEAVEIELVTKCLVDEKIYSGIAEPRAYRRDVEGERVLMKLTEKP
ncbi:hypothetical protein NA56DRAFT_756357 [Hyaloscypha hepaticicola]|uniref:Uncharacterized protein n=1 Tax=Hyaloscypha hepaticicola TaxID=2082293 RepID=A0A2J6PFD9_9HELO|nr:hypothetical protein NA56DRAFT_756357 [Hyaloscypha hepaticicola]